MDSILIFLFLVLFPFGQIVRIGILQPIDVIAGLGALWAVLKHYKRPDAFKYVNLFLIFAFASWLFSIFIFGSANVFYGLLYLVRLVAYSYFFIYVWNFARKSLENRQLLTNSLLLLSIVSGLFGWIQYVQFPALKAFMVWGWDEHLFRLAGTFLDPTFLGIALVFGILLTICEYFRTKKKLYIAPPVFLSVSLAFTYSRASYLALFAGLLVFAWQKKIMAKILLVIIVFIGLVLVLPTKDNTVLKFTRQFSAIARLEDYQTTIKIFEKSPLFGVGYDNMCLAYNKYIGAQSVNSHACSGSDSSILFILATTGIMGLIVFIYSFYKICEEVLSQHNFTKSEGWEAVPPVGCVKLILSSSLAALFVHSLFSNSLFYPWVMGWVLILLASSLAEG